MSGASLVAAYSVARLASGVTVATMVTAIVGTGLVAALSRRPTVALAVGVLAVAVGALWFGLQAAVVSGFPDMRAARVLRTSLQSSRALLESFHLPLAHTPGVVLLSVLVGGLVAIAGRAMGTYRPAVSLAPAVVVTVWSTILLPTVGAACAGLALGACGLVLLVGVDDAVRGVATAVAGISLAAAVLAVGFSSVAGSEVAAPGGPEAPAVAPSALSLATDLTRVERRDANVVLFRSRSSVPSYWQVTALTAYTGDRWRPDPATTALIMGSAPARGPGPPTGSHVYRSGVTLAAYSGRLLPAPPMTVAATGDGSPVVTPSGVVATTPMGLRGGYTVTSVVPSPVSDTASSVAPPAADTALGPIPGAVRALALTITGAQSSPLGKAEALTDFFRSGRFHYSVDASQPAGTDPLVAFLTETRTGSCEEFAGAFAVLARAAGLPTRVAVGFTPGRPDNGVTVVRGSDAHAWPQVLIGVTWASFEPTPQLPSGELSPPGVLGPSGLGNANPTGPPTRPPVSVPVVTTPSPTIPPPAVTAASGAPDGRAAVAVAVTLFLLLAVAAVVGFRRRRRSRQAPVDRLVALWGSIDRALARRGSARPVWRTPMAHVRVLSTLQGDDPARATVEDLAVVASVLEDVAYGSARLTAEQTGRAVRAGARARRAILAGVLARGGPADVAAPEPRPAPDEFAAS